MDARILGKAFLGESVYMHWQVSGWIQQKAVVSSSTSRSLFDTWSARQERRPMAVPTLDTQLGAATVSIIIDDNQ